MVDEIQDHDQDVILGGAQISAKDDYLKTITNLFYKINAAADSKDVESLQWQLNYLTDMLISSILKAETRDAMRLAKEDIYQVEQLKIKMRKKNDTALTDSEDKQARITACVTVVGEIRQFLDKYYGFETKLSALV